MRPRGVPQSAGLWGIVFVVSCVFVTGCGVVVSAKKGVGTWYFPHVDRAMAEINVSWFYTWEPHTMGITQPDRVEFVPMIWDETFVDPKQLQLAKKSGSVLLGFNEPDRTDEANMTVHQALDLWPHLMATGMRLGSPSTAANPSLSGSWLEQFMNGANARGYRVDFLCVHWYGEEFDIDVAVNSLKNFLQTVHHKFGLPIWLTEYSLIRWSDPPVYPSWGATGTIRIAVHGDARDTPIPGALCVVLPATVDKIRKRQDLALRPGWRVDTSGGWLSEGCNHAGFLSFLGSASLSDAQQPKVSEQPMKFEVVINSKTEKQIGLTIPPNVRRERIGSYGDSLSDEPLESIGFCVT